MKRVVVRKPVHLGRLIEIMLLSGAACGFALAAVAPDLHGGMVFSLAQSVESSIGLFLVYAAIPVLVGSFLGAFCVRVRSVVAGFTVFTFAYGTVMAITARFALEDEVGAVDAGVWLLAPVFATAFMIPIVILSGLVVLFIRMFVLDHVIQSGTLCTKCGYDLHAIDSCRCPECGSAAPTRRAETESENFIRSHWRWAPRIVLPVVLVLVFMTKFSQSVANSQFYGAVGGNDSGVLLPWIQGGPNPNWSDWMARGALVDVPGHPSLRVAVITSGGRSGAPAAQIRLLQISAATPPGWPPAVADGSPPIVCDLDQSQLAILLESGIPDAMFRDLIDLATLHAWSSQRSTTPFDSLAGLEVLDATQYFDE